MLIFHLAIILNAGLSYAWMGRMTGMGDPYGLVNDESDFLIHPALILNGEGKNYYGDYRYKYGDVKDWDFDLNDYDLNGNLDDYYHIDTSGHEDLHEILVGGTLPLNQGRLGVFLSYSHCMGAYDGDGESSTDGLNWNYDFDSDLDDFSLRLLYGRPLLGMKTGSELAVSYNKEENVTWANTVDKALGTRNYMWTWSMPMRSLLPIMPSYESESWDVLLKLGAHKNYGAAELSMTLKASYVIFSENSYKYRHESPVGENDYNVDLDGDIDGYSVASDIWFRVPLGNDWELPFLLAIDYSKKARDGQGLGTGTNDSGQSYGYEHEDQYFELKCGGGIEKKLGNNTIVGAGVYYSYLQAEDDIWFTRNDNSRNTHDEFPFRKVHQLELKLIGEKAFSSVTTLRAGLDIFYGCISEDFTRYRSTTGLSYTDNVSIDGEQWGIGVNAGGSVEFNRFIIEPFVFGGYQELDLDGSGSRRGDQTNNWEMKKERREWFIGGGSSVKFPR
jgi:hypothetical protein